MGHILRQLVLMLVVTIVSASMALSAGKAAMALECDMTLSRASLNALTANFDALPAHGGPDHGRLEAAEAEAEHRHDGHAGNDSDASRDAHASHCEAHACPSSAIAAFGGLTQTAVVGRDILLLPAKALAELTVGEGLRRPPRA